MKPLHPRLILVCGLPGSGKTTLARSLQRAHKAIRLSADDWMLGLGIDLWDEPMRDRVEKLQWQFAQDLLALNQVVVIEWGTWSRAERDSLRLRARELGAAVELHQVDAPIDTLLARLQERNRESPPIQRADLLKWSAAFERPTSEELALFDAALSAE